MTSYFQPYQRKLRTLNFLLCILIGMVGLHHTSYAAQDFSQLPPSVLQALKSAKVPLSATSWWVAKTNTPTALLSVNADKSMNPASTMKLVTTQAALQLLGPQFRWRTDILTDGDVRDHTLTGNLYLRGQGDPNFIPEELEKMLRELRAQGIDTLQGNLVLDKSFFAPLNSDSTIDGETQKAYNVAPDALLYAYKALSFHFDSESAGLAASTPNITASPLIAQLRIANAVQLNDRECDSNWKNNLKAQVYLRNDGTVSADFSGSIPRHCVDKDFNVAILDHNRFIWGGVVAMWESLGGRFLPPYGLREGKTPSSARLLVTHEGLNLSESIKRTNKFSNNVMARQIFLSIGAFKTQLPATTTTSSQVIGAWLVNNHLTMPELVLDNGSGLSRKERISTRHMGALLDFALQNRGANEFVESLPLVGIDGTMKKRLVGQLGTAQAQIKSGTLDGVRAIAGYVTNGAGEKYIVVSFINHNNAAQAQLAHDAFLLWVAGVNGTPTEVPEASNRSTEN